MYLQRSFQGKLTNVSPKPVQTSENMYCLPHQKSPGTAWNLSVVGSKDSLGSDFILVLKIAKVVRVIHLATL